jgi:hypothetical protein
MEVESIDDLTLEKMKDAIDELDPDWNRNNINFLTILVFLTAVKVGIDIDKVSQFIGRQGVKDKIIRDIFKRMEEYGIVVTTEDGGKGFAVEWFNDEDMCVSLILDMMTVNGQLTRRVVDGKFVYSKTEHFGLRWRNYNWKLKDTVGAAR